MKNKLKILSVAAALALSAPLWAGTFAFAEDETPTFPTYTQEFSSAESVNEDFDAGYVNALGNSTVPETVDSDGHWYLENGTLVRRGDIEGSAGTWRAAVLTYNKQLFSNFEMEVDYKQGNQTFWWTCVAFRQTEAGKSFFDDGAGIFVQESGVATMWGAVGVGGPFEKPKYDSYNRNEWHHLKLTVQGNKAVLVIDSNPAVEWTLNASFYQEGYVSLISINNDSAFDNLKITELPEPETPELPPIPPKAEADTDDALSKLATINDDVVKVERPLNKREPSQGSNSTSPQSGCGSVVGTGFAAGGAVTVVAAAIALKRKHK